MVLFIGNTFLKKSLREILSMRRGAKLAGSFGYLDEIMSDNEGQSGSVEATQTTSQSVVSQTQRRANSSRNGAHNYEQLAHRLQQLNKVSWSAAKVADVLKPEYVSSEESEHDENDQQMKYVIHCLPWQSNKLRLAKKKLDNMHKESLSRLGMLKLKHN